MGSFSRQRSAPATDNGSAHFPEDWPKDAQPDATPSDREAMRSVLLAKAVEYEIIPRLMLAHQVPEECMAHPIAHLQQVTPEDVAVFSELVLHEDDQAVRDSVVDIRDRGVPLQAIFLDLLTPVARHLGEMWERDLCSFTEVTAGLGRLQKILREHSASMEEFKNAAPIEDGRRILLMPCPGEQHTFGLSMVAEMFQRAHWDVVTCFLVTDSASELVKKEWYDVIGFSLGSELGVGKLQAAVASVRQASKNPHISIIAGGPIFVRHPEFAEQIQADAIMTDGAQAPAQAAQLVTQRLLHSNNA